MAMLNHQMVVTSALFHSFPASPRPGVSFAGFLFFAALLTADVPSNFGTLALGLGVSSASTSGPWSTERNY
jgi:hypothetical protein